MDWNSLKIFLAIAHQGSLSGAAKELGINHSTVFRRLNSLEQELGGRLFERLAHGYHLTTVGEEVLDLAQKIAADCDDLERRVLGKDIEPKGTVKLTAPNNIAYRYLPRYLADFNQLYPEIRIELLVSNLAFNMTNREADIAVRATLKPPVHLIGKKLRDIKWGVYANKQTKHLVLPRTLKDLANHRLIGGNGAMIDLPAFSWLEKTFPKQINIKCNDMVSMSYFAETGQGLAFLPDDQQRPEIQRLFTFEPGRVSQLWLLSHPDLRNVERIKLLMRFLGDKFGKEENL